MNLSEQLRVTEISPQKAEQQLEEAKRFLARYRANPQILEELGLQQGDPFQKMQAIGDLARIASLRGELGIVEAALEREVSILEDQYLTLKSEIYLDKYQAVKNGIIQAKNSDEALNNLVRTDERYIRQRRKISEAKGHKIKFLKAVEGLFALENALKKAIDHSEGV